MPPKVINPLVTASAKLNQMTPQEKNLEEGLEEYLKQSKKKANSCKNPKRT